MGGNFESGRTSDAAGNEANYVPAGDNGAWPPRINIRSALLTGIFVLLLLNALYVAAEVLIPLVLALLFSLVFSPLVRSLERTRIPAPVGALVAVLTLIAIIGSAVYFLSEPASTWMAEAPSALRKIEGSVAELRKPIEDIQAAADSVGQLTDDTSKPEVVEVKVRENTLVDAIVNAAPATLAGFAAISILMFFMLASGDQFLRRFVEQIPRFRDKKAAVETVRAIQRSLSRYLYTITLINLALGALTAAMLFALGVPNPFLWGTMAALMNFAPYVGALAMGGLLLLVGLTSFDTFSQAVVPAGLFLLLTTIEGQIVTPLIAGRNLRLNPVAIVVTIILLGWMWGVVGVLVAVPVLVCAKITFERTSLYKPFVVFLERYPHR
jgi:predicted PurR-regulated permease PerM